MRKTLLALLGVLVLASVSVGPVYADKLYPARWSYMSSWETAYIVEQQTPCLPDGTACGATNPDPSLWTVNNTGCAWDPDDQRNSTLGWLSEYLDPGQSVSGGWCMYADTAIHLNSLYLRETNLVGTLKVGDYFTLTIPGGHRGCIAGPEYDTYDGMPPVPNSNGGVGIRSDVTFTATSISNRRIRGVHGDAEMAYAGWSPVSPCAKWPYHQVGTEVRGDGYRLWWWVE